jgi:hypothetical protein
MPFSFRPLWSCFLADRREPFSLPCCQDFLYLDGLRVALTRLLILLPCCQDFLYLGSLRVALTRLPFACRLSTTFVCVNTLARLLFACRLSTTFLRVALTRLLFAYRLSTTYIPFSVPGSSCPFHCAASSFLDSGLRHLHGSFIRW